MASSNSLSYKSSIDVRLLADQKTMVVDQRNWSRLKDTVKSFNPSQNNWWANFASAFLGIAASAFITWWSLPENEHTIICVVLLCAAIGFLLAFILCLIFSICHARSQASSIEQIQKEIEFIEDSLSDTQTDESD